MLPLTVAAGGSGLASIPWPLLMALGSLGLIFLLFHRRAEAFADFGFSGREVALLCLGSIAGWAVNLPVVPLGNSYMAVNLGGALVPVLLVCWWVWKRKLPIVRTLVGILLVSVVAYAIVRFDPALGIVAVFPWFFLPSVVALVYALVAAFPHPMRSVPIAYSAGSLGALLGADVYNLGQIMDYYRGTEESVLVSLGGAGVFDMVFLAGALAMATDLAIVLALPKQATADDAEDATAADAAATLGAYPAEGFEVRDAPVTLARFRRLEDPTPLEESAAALAASNLALREGDGLKSVRMSWLAVDLLLREPAVRDVVEAHAGEAFHRDVHRLAHVADAERDPGRVEAGKANVTAKRLVGVLAPLAGDTYRLEVPAV